MDNQDIYRGSLIAGLLIVAIAIILYMTWNWGMGVAPDSVKYFEAAANFLSDGHLAIQKPDGEFGFRPKQPPLYPLLLSAGLLMGLTAEQSALLFSLSGFAAVLAFVVLILVDPFEGHPVEGLFGGVLFLFLPGLLHVFTMAWTETVFLGFLTGYLYFTLRFIRSRHNQSLYFAFLFLALMGATRYSAIPYYGISGLMLVIFFLRNELARVGGVLIGFALSTVPLLAHCVNNWLTVGHSTGEPLHFVLPGQPTLDQTIGGLSDFVTYGTSLLAETLILPFLILYVIVGLLSIVGSENTGTAPDSDPHLFLFLCSFGYFLFIWTANIIQPGITLGNRHFTPALIPFVLLVLTITITARTSQRSTLASTGYGCLVATLIFGLVSSVHFIEQRHNHGARFSGKLWANTQFIEAVDRLPESRTLYSNVPELIFYKTDRKPYRVPKKWNGPRANKNHSYKDERARMFRRLSPEGYLAMSMVKNWWIFNPTPSEIQTQFEMRRVFTGPKGIIERLRQREGTKQKSGR